MIKQAFLGLTALTVTVLPPQAIGAPNIVFILADDLGWRDLGCQGSTFYETPNLDRLAHQGLRFTNAYASCPVCSPTRASYLTGKSSARLHLTDWIPGMRLPHARILPPDSEQTLPLRELTLAERLRQSGYATAHVGKWHLGGQTASPEQQGFDVNVAGSHFGLPHTYFAPYKLPKLTEGPDGEYLTDRLATEATRVIEKFRDRPFFLSLCFYAVHTPIQGKPELVATYRDKLQTDSSQKDPAYAAMVHSLDESVGTVLRKLDELKLSDNTIIVFTSDNGGYQDATNNAPLRAGKGHLYEGGIRVPLLIRWPNVISAGNSSDEPVVTTDFAPTLLTAADSALDSTEDFDGVSLVPILRDPQATLNRDAICWYYPHYSPQNGRPGAAIRRGAYKLIEFYDPPSVELYNLHEDHGEKHDLEFRMPERTAELLDQLRKWLQHVGAAPPLQNPNYNAKDPTHGRRFPGWVP